MTRPRSPDDRAQALFKKEAQAQLSQQATSQYRAEQQATLDKTARLRELRLAREKEQLAATDAANKGGGSVKQGPSRRARPAHQRPRGRS
jgi:hypothetical protein